MEDKIVIVSGLPRSGTSLCMKMLDAGGVEVLTDNVRRPDIDNPNGYYEYEIVKKIKEDTSWIRNAHGKAFKMVSMLLYDLPPEFEYKIVFMKREMSEVLASQSKMLSRLETNGAKVGDEQMSALFRKHLTEIEKWLEEQPNIEVLFLDYGDVVLNPKRNAERIKDFLGGSPRSEMMISVVDSSLYRNRADATSNQAAFS